jgi:hypothetical protein
MSAPPIYPLGSFFLFVYVLTCFRSYVVVGRKPGGKDEGTVDV